MTAAQIPRGSLQGSLREALGLSRERMARLLSTSSKSVERWETASGLPVRDRLVKLDQLVAIGLTVYTRAGLQRFVATPMSEFAGLTPLQMIEIGQMDRVLSALAADYEGLGS